MQIWITEEELKQIVLEEKDRLESALVPSGHIYVNQQLRAQFGKMGWAKDQMNGIGYLFALREWRLKSIKSGSLF